MKIDEPGRDKISVNVDNVFPAHTSLLMNCGNFSSFHDNFEAIANSVGENQTRVRKNHFLVSATNSVGEAGGFPARPASSPTITSPTGTDCRCSLPIPLSLLAIGIDA